MYMLVNGNVSSIDPIKTFPQATIRPLNSSSQPRLFELYCSGRQQLISVGRTHALQYTYFWKEPLDQKGLCPKVHVTDIKGSFVAPGETYDLPHNKTLIFNPQYDGELIVLNKNRVVEKRIITADVVSELDGLHYGLSIKVVIGLDEIWHIEFKKRQGKTTNNDAELLGRITSVSGAPIPAPHSLKNIMLEMSRYPLICQWIRKCINDGSINEQSYRRLQEIYFEMHVNK